MAGETTRAAANETAAALNHEGRAEIDVGPLDQPGCGKRRHPPNRPLTCCTPARSPCSGSTGGVASTMKAESGPTGTDHHRAKPAVPGDGQRCAGCISSNRRTAPNTAAAVAANRMTGGVRRCGRSTASRQGHPMGIPTAMFAVLMVRAQAGSMPSTICSQLTRYGNTSDADRREERRDAGGRPAKAIAADRSRSAAATRGRGAGKPAAEHGDLRRSDAARSR